LIGWLILAAGLGCVVAAAEQAAAGDTGSALWTAHAGYAAAYVGLWLAARGSTRSSGGRAPQEFSSLGQIKGST